MSEPMPLPSRQLDPQIVHTAMLAMLNAAITAQVAQMLQIQVPATDVMNILCEHIGKLLALIEPDQLRNSILGEIRRNLPAVMNRHYEARMTTAGGVRVPGPGERVQ
jgi:uncharacterized membrane protein YkvI